MFYQLLFFAVSMLYSTAYAMETKQVVAGLCEEGEEAPALFWIQTKDDDILSMPLAAAQFSKLLTSEESEAVYGVNSEENPFIFTQENSTIAQLYIAIASRLAAAQNAQSSESKQKQLKELDDFIIASPVDNLIAVYKLAFRLDATPIIELLIKNFPFVFAQSPIYLAKIAGDIKGQLPELTMSETATKYSIEKLVSFYPDDLFLERLRSATPQVTPLNLTRGEVEALAAKKFVAKNPKFPITVTIQNNKLLVKPDLGEAYEIISQSSNAFRTNGTPAEVTWSADGRTLAASVTFPSLDTTRPFRNHVRIWKLQENLTLESGNQESVDTFDHLAEPNSIALSPHGETLAIGYTTGFTVNQFKSLVKNSYSGFISRIPIPGKYYNYYINRPNDAIIEQIKFNSTNLSVYSFIPVTENGIKYLRDGQQHVYSISAGLSMNQALYLPIMYHLQSTEAGKKIIQDNLRLLTRAGDSFTHLDQNIMHALQGAQEEVKRAASTPAGETKREIAARAEIPTRQAAVPSVQQDLALLHHSLMALSREA